MTALFAAAADDLTAAAGGGVDSGFSMSTLLDDYAIYSDAKDFKVALRRESGVIYGNRTPLPHGYYRIVGIEEFKTVRGTNEQVPTIRRLE
jgi:hypothetical protein